MTGARSYQELGSRVYESANGTPSERASTVVSALEALYSFGSAMGYLSIIVAELTVLAG